MMLSAFSALSSKPSFSLTGPIVYFPFNTLEWAIELPGEPHVYLGPLWKGVLWNSFLCFAIIAYIPHLENLS